MERTWRLIDSGPGSASYNMALDEAIAAFIRKNSLPPVLRLYGWDRQSLSLGYFQKTQGVNTDYCEAADIPIVRRPTGGRAILHGDELTYSFSSCTCQGTFSKGLLDSYKKISAAFHLAFRKIGISAEPKLKRENGGVLAGSPLCFQSSSYGEILINNKKVVGSAQKRWSDGLLQQGCIPYSHDDERMRNIFGQERLASLRSSMGGLREILPGFDDVLFKRIVAASFEETFGISFVQSLPSQEELALAQELQRKKYLTGLWKPAEQPPKVSASFQEGFS